MIRFAKATLVATLAAASAQSIGAQALASRVDAINEGRVQFNFAARPGVCGNGKTWYSTSPGNINGNVMVANRSSDLAPKVLAASSRPLSTFSRDNRIARTMSGNDMTAVASAAPLLEKISSMPKVVYSQ